MKTFTCKNSTTGFADWTNSSAEKKTLTARSVDYSGHCFWKHTLLLNFSLMVTKQGQARETTAWKMYKSTRAVYSHTYAWVCTLRRRRSTKGKHTLGLSSTASTSTYSTIISSNDNANLSGVGIAHFPVTRLRGPGLFLYCDRRWTWTLGFSGYGWGRAVRGPTPTIALLLPGIGCLLCTHDSSSAEPVLLLQKRDKYLSWIALQQTHTQPWFRHSCPACSISLDIPAAPKSLLLLISNYWRVEKNPNPSPFTLKPGKKSNLSNVSFQILWPGYSTNHRCDQSHCDFPPVWWCRRKSASSYGWEPG